MTSPPTLRHLAEAATPGPWTSTGLKYGSIYIFGPDSAMVADRHEENDEPRAIVRMRGTGAGLPQEANAAYIAAANPQSVLALLAERDAHAQQIATLRAELFTSERFRAEDAASHNRELMAEANARQAAEARATTTAERAEYWERQYHQKSGALIAADHDLAQMEARATTAEREREEYRNERHDYEAELFGLLHPAMDYKDEASALDLANALIAERDSLRAETTRLQGERDAALATSDRYQELIYAVESKHPDETRHQTALRYIRKAEHPAESQATAALRPEPPRP